MDSVRPERRRGPALGARSRATSLSSSIAGRARPSSALRGGRGGGAGVVGVVRVVGDHSPGRPGAVGRTLAHVPRVRTRAAAAWTRGVESRPVLGPPLRAGWSRRSDDGPGGSGPGLRRGAAPGGLVLGGRGNEHLTPRRQDATRRPGPGGSFVSLAGDARSVRRTVSDGRMRATEPGPRVPSPPPYEAPPGRPRSLGRIQRGRTADHSPVPGDDLPAAGSRRPGALTSGSRGRRTREAVIRPRAPSIRPQPLELAPPSPSHLRAAESGAQGSAIARQGPPIARRSGASRPTGRSAPAPVRPGQGPADRGGPAPAPAPAHPAPPRPATSSESVDRPRRLPEWSRPMVRAITGRDDLPDAVTGPGTRRALHALRTPAATIGRTVALAEPPSRSPRSLGILAHELSHVADRPRTPRLFGESLLDAGERRARAAGSAVSSLASRSASEALGASPVSSLPVGGAAGLAGAAARSLTSAAPRLPEGVPGLPASVGAVSGAARELRGRAEAALPALPSAEEMDRSLLAPIAGMAGQAQQVASGAASDATGLAERAGRAARELGGEDPTAYANDLIVALEDRLLAEIERRGGRFAGLF